MSSIEDEIVSLKFDNRQFEPGVSSSIASLSKLQTSLQFKNATTGLDGIQTAANGINLQRVADGVSHISNQFNALKFAARVAFATIIRQATYSAEHFIAAFTIDPIKAGFANYEQQINATKTILSNTAASGATLKDVTKTLAGLNKYANLTVYNFSEMAKNIGTFTAAGVALKPATAAIKGIANLAAFSGSTSDQASSAMYQLSQAIAAGQVHLQDWNSVVNAGIGGTVFQRALTETAVQMGNLDKSQVKLSGSMKNVSINGAAFRQSLTPPPGGTSWLTSKVLTNTLAQFTGDLTQAQLKAQGYSKAQRDAIIAQGKTALNAATQVKTFSQLTQALKEEVASAWAGVFKAIFGNITEATSFFTPLHNILQNFFTAPVNDLAKFLTTFRKFGGITASFQILGNIFKIIGNLLYPIKVLLGAIFPSSGNSSKGVATFTKSLATFTEWLVKVTSVTREFHPQFTILHKVFGLATSAFVALMSALRPLLPVLGQLADYVGNLFNEGMGIAGNLIEGWTKGLDPAALKKAASDLANSWIMWIKDALGIRSPATTMIPIGENIINGIVQGLINASQGIIRVLQNIFVGLGQIVKAASQNIHWSDVLDTLNSALFLGVVLLFRRFVQTFSGIIDSWKAVMGSAGGVLDQLTSNLKTMQSKVKSEIIRNIAISIGILAVSALLLSTIDGKKLGISIGAITGMMVALITAMKVLTFQGKGAKNLDAKTIAKQTGQIVALGVAMIEFATAILILTSAVALMGQLDPKTMTRGLEGIGAVIAGIIAATAILSKTGGGKTMLATSTALLILSASLTTFAGVMVLYSKLSWGLIASGGGKAALVIVAVGLAMKTFSGGGSIGGAVGLTIASAALIILAKALKILSSIGLFNMIKAVAALSFVLSELTVAAYAMSLAEGGAASMVVMAAAIIVLAEALKILSGISVGNMVKAIIALAVVLGVVAGAAILLSPAVPLIAALGSAILLFGVAALAAGLGVLAFATGMGILAVVGPAAFQALSDGLDVLLKDLPRIGEAIGGFLVSILTGIAKAAGPLAKALGKLLQILLEEVTKLIPKLQHLVQKLINATLEIIAHSAGHSAKVMLGFALSMLDALDKAVPRFIDRGSSLVIAIITGLGKNGVKIANATGQAILDFLKGLDKAINKYEWRIIAEGLTIGKDLVKGMVIGIGNGIGDVGAAAGALAKHALDVVKNPLHWHINSPSLATKELGRGFGEGAALGIRDMHGAVEKESHDMAHKALNAMKMTFAKSNQEANGLGGLRPKITPILDLSQLARDAKGISSHMGHPVITADVSRRRARDIASDEFMRRQNKADAKGGDSYEFVQNNYSPEPINHVKAYRGHKSQIALFREVTSK